MRGSYVVLLVACPACASVGDFGRGRRTRDELPARWHYELARKLAPLRDEGVLIMGSGNMVHNLHTYSWGKRSVEPYDWALRFETTARQALSAAEFSALVDYESLGRDAMLAAPTPDHYLPLLYVLAQHQPGERVSFPVGGFDGGSISMLAVRIG